MLTLDKLHLQQGSFELNADWSIAKGVKLAVLGASGAGKSTLLSALGGFSTPVSGEVRWDGVRIDNLSPSKRPVTMLFQDHNLFGHLDVAQNVALGIDPSLRLSKSQSESVSETLEKVGLGRLGGRKPSELSGGQQSRVALARAIIRDRSIWLLDEPFSALGPGLRREMLDLVSEAAQSAGATVLMVTHDPTDAQRFSNLAVFVENGVAGPPVPTTKLFARPPSGLRSYLGT